MIDGRYVYHKISKHLAWREFVCESKVSGRNIKTMRQIIANPEIAIKAYLTKKPKVELPYTLEFLNGLGDNTPLASWYHSLTRHCNSPVRMMLVDADLYRIELDDLDMWTYDKQKADEFYMKHFKPADNAFKPVPPEAEEVELDVELGDD